MLIIAIGIIQSPKRHRFPVSIISHVGRSHSKTSCCLKSKNIALFDTILLNLTVPFT
ncbi:hypothetical protein [Candidatus Tisiphia endosymbiont of Neophilaenus lineatus]|uniref:hypothetical protein n=1 Tax=Candidatus Tisiphia endosymbiont of Neophilaenus lineatus TaxID=3139336 RepID=UPI0035CA9C4D